MTHNAISQDLAVDGLIVLDEEWRCTRTMGGVPHLLHKPEHDILGRVVWNLLPATFDKRTCERWRLAVQDRNQTRLGEHRTSDGHRVACRFLPAEAGGSLCFVDVTELEESLEQVNAERRRIEDFLAVLAHELRNPLASLCHGITRLERTATEPGGKRMLERLQRQLRYFVRTVEDLVDVSNIVRGRVKLRRERCDVQALIRYAVACIRPLAAAKHHRIEVGPTADAAVDADLTRLEQVFINLLRNAVANTEPGGKIFIDARNGGDLVRIRVKDTGIGIPPQRIPFLFEPSYTGVAARAETGLGIGLGVVRRIVELHGGNVTAHSAGAGQGSEFVVSLPKAQGSCVGVGSA